MFENLNVVADSIRLKQVFLNLLTNAIKYNRPAGTVTLDAKVAKEKMKLVVRDTGYGIPEDAMPHLFKKFFRVHEIENKVVGTGLGLSISKQIVQGHRGRIEVQSKFGKGTTFTVYLPLHAAQD